MASLRFITMVTMNTVEHSRCTGIQFKILCYSQFFLQDLRFRLPVMETGSTVERELWGLDIAAHAENDVRSMTKYSVACVSEELFSSAPWYIGHIIRWWCSFTPCSFTSCGDGLSERFDLSVLSSSQSNLSVKIFFLWFSEALIMLVLYFLVLNSVKC